MRSTEAVLHLSLAVTGPATIEMTDVGGGVLHEGLLFWQGRFKQAPC